MFQGQYIQYTKHLGRLVNIRSMKDGLSKLSLTRFFDEGLYGPQNCSTNILEIF